MEAIRNLVNNAWRWDLNEFARKACLDPEDPDTQQAFLDFQKAGDALRHLDNDTISVIISNG